MSIENRQQTIKARLIQAIQPEVLTVTDESAAHQGHVGARSGAGHYAVFIVATLFQGMNLVQRHRVVYDALKALLKEDIHALRITAYTPEEYSTAGSTV